MTSSRFDGLDFRFSIALPTRMISPSRRPSDRNVDSFISGRMLSSILSRSNEDEYLVQSSISHPASRKNLNQSIMMAFLDFGLGSRDSFCDNVPSGTSSSSLDRERNADDGPPSFVLVMLSI